MKHRIAVWLMSGALALTLPAAAAAPLWQDVPLGSMAVTGPRLIAPEQARTFTLDLAATTAVLRSAPAESAPASQRPLLVLPRPEGGTLALRIAQVPMMEPGLAAKYPQLRAYAGVDPTNPAVTGRFNLGPRGFRGMVFTPRGTLYIDPLARGDTRHYQAYYAHDLPYTRRAPDRVLTREGESVSGERIAPSAPDAVTAGVSIGGNLRTYRVAIATTGEYAEFHDPPTGPGDLPEKAIILDELLVLVNRVSGVYERDLGIRLTLVANNDLVIFQNPTADPYKNDDGISMLAQNTAVLDAILTPLAYDIGHVVSTGGGGVAFLGVVCFEPLKGGGVTGLPAPVTDDFYIDYVAHEMGHQFGGNHTFNGTEGSCGGNEGADTAYEPGSGVTIMAYAGICGTQNIAAHSIDTFHAASFDEIVAYTRNSDGNTCGTVSASGNRPPVVTVPTESYTIPAGTPFEITASATDPDGDALTYQWEEMDLGPGGHPNAAATSSDTPPLFRSFLPVATPHRTFPQLKDLVDDTQTIGEILPATTRKMDFRLTVRDNHVFPSAGGVASADYRVNVTAAAGPFRVLHPHAKSVYSPNASMPVEWAVANTTAAPVSCASVDILLSNDRGQSFPVVLADDTPNDGAETVNLPADAGTGTLLKVKCSTNIFFALSTENFLENLAAPVLSVASAPDPNGTFTLGWTRPATATGPDTIQESASCGPVFTDDASEPLVAGANSKWSGSAQWTTQDDPSTGSPSYFIPDLVNQVESLALIEPIAIPAGAVSTMSFTTTQGIENGFDEGRVRISVDGAPFRTIARWTGPPGITPLDVIEATRTVDLTPYAGHSIRLEFLFLSDLTNEGAPAGWYVDNIAITATVFEDLATVPGTSLTLSNKPLGGYCYRARTVHQIKGQIGPSPYSNVVDVAVTQTNAPPVAALAATPQSGQTPLDVTFSAAGSSDPDGDAIVTYAFDFGDGTAPVSQAGSSVVHRYTAAGEYAATVTITDARGATSVSAPVTVAVSAADPDDTSPDPFTFVERTNVNTNVFVTSEARTITGINAPVQVSVANGQYSIDGGAFTTAAGSIVGGQTLRVRHVSSDAAGGTTTTTVTVGDYTTTFKSTTTTTDRTPDAFFFETQTGVERATEVISNQVTLTGFNVAVPVQAGPNSLYRLNGGSWTSEPGTANPNDTLETKHTSSSSGLTYTKTYVKVGGVTGYFTTRTK